MHYDTDPMDRNGNNPATKRPRIRLSRVCMALAFLACVSVAYVNRESIADALHPAKVWDTSEYGMPLTLSDGRTCVFTHSRTFYRLEGGGLMPFSGASPNYFIDVKTIGTYDVATGKITVLHKKRHKRHGDGRGKYVLHSFVGNTVLVIEEATEQVDFQTAGRYYLLNVRSGSMVELPLEREFERYNVRRDYSHFVREDGTIVFTQDYRSAYGRAWVRQANGEYAYLGNRVQYQEFKKNEVFYVDELTDIGFCNPYRAYNVDNDTVREARAQETEGLARRQFEQQNRAHALWVQEDHKSLCIGSRGNEQPVQIPERLLK